MRQDEPDNIALVQSRGHRLASDDYDQLKSAIKDLVVLDVNVNQNDDSDESGDQLNDTALNISSLALPIK